MLLFGGAVMVALAVDHVDLHKRIAIGLLCKIQYRTEWWVFSVLFHYPS